MRHKDVQETEIVNRGEEDGMSDGIAATSGRGTTSLGDSRVEIRQRRGRKCLVRQREGQDETGLWRRCAAAGVLRATPDMSPSIFGACHVHCYLSIWLDGISHEKLYRFLHLPSLLTFCWCEQREWTFATITDTLGQDPSNYTTHSNSGIASALLMIAFLHASMAIQLVRTQVGFGLRSIYRTILAGAGTATPSRASTSTPLGTQVISKSGGKLR